MLLACFISFRLSKRYPCIPASLWTEKAMAQERSTGILWYICYIAQRVPSLQEVSISTMKLLSSPAVRVTGVFMGALVCRGHPAVVKKSMESSTEL